MKKLFTTLFMSFMVIFAFGQTNITVNGINYTSSGTNTVQVSQGGTYTGTIIIPTSVNYSGVTYHVTSIGSAAFEGCNVLTSVMIPSSITSIGSAAFEGCTGLTSVTIPSSVASIGSSTFSNCTGLTSVSIPSSVTSIGYLAFEYCSALTSVTIPSSVTSIGIGAFGYCTGLTSVTIPSSVTSIGSGAFESCTGLTSVTIPSSVTSIENSTFANCTSLNSVTIPSSVTFIGSFAFEYCTGLITVDAGNLNYSSLYGVLYNKTKTLLIQCPTSKSGNLMIPSSVSSIGDYAFESCSGLTSVTIPLSVTSIGGGAFESCTGLTSIIAYPAAPVDLTSTSDVFNGVNIASCILYVPPFSLSLYKSANQWKYFTNTINIFNPITTTQLTNITTTTASGGGNITSDGGFTVTDRGVCWSITANPTIANNMTSEGTGTGIFSSNITGLNPGTTYHVRAYATNSTGTAYGSDITFTTLANSTEVYLNNIAFISSAQDGTQLNVPSTMTMNTTNPNNYVNPGNLVRFKMQCFNKKSNGINIVSGSCKVRCNDPYITLTDSTSGLNNVGWNASAWSSDEFEFKINSTTPWGYIAYVDFEVIEGSNSYFTYKVPIPVAPLSLQSKTVDDDNNPDSHGNSNGICEPNEIIETLPTLQNVSNLSANSVSGTFGNYYGAASINIWNNRQGSSGTVVNNSYWNYAFGAPQIITAGAKDLLPQWDFVFDYNYTSTYHFTLGLAMSGSFNLFSGYKSFIKWLIPIDYNVGYPDFNTGISDNYIENIDFYPNPTDGIININIGSGNFTDCLVNITNSLGQRVYKSKLYTEKTTLDLTKISNSGLLYIQIINNKGAIIGEKKILVK